ncbi:hypothetical protein D3C85_958610 [compost metagenome]
MEPGVADEILGDQRGTADLALGIPHQAAVGLIRERDLGHAGDHQWIGDAGDQRHQDQQAQGRAYQCGHFKILEFTGKNL